MRNIIKIILIISISLAFLGTSLEYHSFNLASYEKSYEKYDLGTSTGKDKESFLMVAEDIIEYLRDGGSIELMERNFNEREVLHMIDVENIFSYSNILKNFALGLAVFIIGSSFLTGKELELYRTIYKGLSINYLIIILFVIMINLDFTKYFTYFHLIFFDNDLWILDPSTDLLIQMMPENFFVDMVIKIGLSYLFAIVISQILAYLAYRRKKSLSFD